VPFLHVRAYSHHYLHRLAIIFLAFSPTFIILTISYEGLFYVTFFATLVLWSELETQIVRSMETPVILANGVNGHAHTIPTKPSFRKLALSDARIALFFFFLLQAGFFATGNIASLSSFSLESVYRLVPVFDPFLMGALLIYKILIPFAGSLHLSKIDVVISANLGILNRKLHVPPSSLFMIVLTISDLLTLNFFYLVRDEGSWLEIGESISHFCICNLLILFIIALEQLSEVFPSTCMC
jgi:GPI ethanolamine phosphate transferase 1